MAKNKTIFKGEKQEFQLHSYEVGRFGGGTQPPIYLDKQGNKVPFMKTKWFKLSLTNKNNGTRQN